MTATAWTPVRRALLSVSDKSGITEFAKALTEQGIELLSTGGTYKLLNDQGIAVTEIADYTGFPEMGGLKHCIRKFMAASLPDVAPMMLLCKSTTFPR